MCREYQYNSTIIWTGNSGTGTDSYRSYERSYDVQVAGKPPIEGSSDPAFRGDRTKYNPEELLLASLSSCHLLWYLHLCSESGIIVTEYVDAAVGIMTENTNGGGRFSKVTLHPTVTVADKGMMVKATELHKNANEMCFIANSVNFPIAHEVTIKTAEQ